MNFAACIACIATWWETEAVVACYCTQLNVEKVANKIDGKLLPVVGVNLTEV